MTADRANDGFDQTEESYLRQYLDSSFAKQSKDDSSIPIETSKSTHSHHHHHHQHHHHHHSTSSHHHHSHHTRHHRTHQDYDLVQHTKSDESYLSGNVAKSPDNHGPSTISILNTLDDISGQSTSTAKNICHPNCWCNNLVEITCRYPTKIITYVSLIENNSSTSHFINTALFDKLVKSNKLSRISEITSSSSVGTSGSGSLMIERPLLNTNNM
jgi:hypothetical protein